MIGYDLPGFGDELCGLPYLPRLIAKARAKLVGSMGDDIIYCCENCLLYTSQSAVPLTEEERSLIQAKLEARYGGALYYRWEVEPSLLAGRCV